MIVAFTGKVNADDTKNYCFQKPAEILAQLSIPKNQMSLVTVTEKIIISAPINEVYQKFVKLPLNHLMTATSKVSGVAYTYPLVGSKYIKEGDRRAVCLIDGYGAIEELTQNTSEQRFAYRVWYFTLPAAESISYGDGEFLFKSVKSGTEIVWNYSFALKENEFPGYLGGMGQWLFRKSFAESDWQPYMHQALINFKHIFKP